MWQNAMKIKGKPCLKEARKRCNIGAFWVGFLRSGGMRGGRILRFAEAGTDSAGGSMFLRFAPNTAEPEQGAGRIQSLRAFRRARLGSTKIY